uniref:Uncharacterized protein n=1 Tax=Anopheles coluzzii TaxID=1518534 RepID=A0A8W7P4U8_ANOCL
MEQGRVPKPVSCSGLQQQQQSTMATTAFCKFAEAQDRERYRPPANLVMGKSAPKNTSQLEPPGGMMGHFAWLEHYFSILITFIRSLLPRAEGSGLVHTSSAARVAPCYDRNWYGSRNGQECDASSGALLLLLAYQRLHWNGSTTAAPRSAYPGAPPPAPATLKGAQRPAMTSPASGIPGAPYRGTAWTQGYAPTQPTYRYTAPQTYAYTPHTTTQI